MQKSNSNKLYFFIIMIVVTILLFVIKTASMQLFVSDYKLSAENNAIRRVVEYPARGLVFDRNGNLIVFNKPIYELMIIPKHVKEFDTLKLCEILDIPKFFFF